MGFWGFGVVAIEGQMEYQREREEAKEGTTSWLDGFILRGEQKVVEHCEEVMG